MNFLITFIDLMDNGEALNSFMHMNSTLFLQMKERSIKIWFGMSSTTLTSILIKIITIFVMNRRHLYTNNAVTVRIPVSLNFA